MDKITIYTWGIFLFSMLLFYWFGRFALRLIKQHNNVYGLLFELDEEEKKER